MCRTRATQPLYNYSIKNESPDDDLFIGTLRQTHKIKDWLVTILIHQQQTTFKIDTGAQCNVIPLWKYYQMCKDPLQPSSASLVAFGGHKLRTHGKVQLPCQHKDNHYLIEFEVVDHNVPNILGLVTCIEMNLVQRIDTVTNKNTTSFEQYYDVFEGLGCVTDVRYHIRINPTKPPVIHPDALSRAYLPEYGESIEDKFDINILQTLPISDIKLHQLKEETKKDPQLQQLSSVIATGWPKTKRDIPAKC